MEQENDWDRDLLLDPAWEKQQRKVRKPEPGPSVWTERRWRAERKWQRGCGVEVRDRARASVFVHGAPNPPSLMNPPRSRPGSALSSSVSQ
ncbi:hypothetical protein OJAV_G00133970 [Oryzias javanicus]|uniref:Uncharacterized protein n=1 Tax=Oryzias javanicus TaxID=123683 RepID=A0A3S2PN18_ORYJA|nr:hypothetical protein OJAV_G00133970 [Oryzias javanicus]